jgi:exopolysaccharide biosynthesis protein
LFVNGVKRITDVEERLVHNKSAARTFVAYDTDSEGRPRHFVMGRSDSQTFAQTADFLQDYFQKAYQSRPHDALCLDGGSSSQIVYKNANGSIEDAEPTGVLVPTALVLVPVKSTGSGKTLIPNPHQLPKRGRVQNVGFHPRGFMSVALLF